MAIINLDENSSVSVNRDLINQIVRLATAEVEGVIQVLSIKVKKKKTGLVINVALVMNASMEATDLAYKVQHNIMTSLMSMIEITLKSINVVIKNAV